MQLHEYRGFLVEILPGANGKFGYRIWVAVDDDDHGPDTLGGFAILPPRCYTYGRALVSAERHIDNYQGAVNAQFDSAFAALSFDEFAARENA